MVYFWEDVMYLQNFKKWVITSLIFIFVCIAGINSAQAARHLANVSLRVVLFPVGAPHAYLFDDLTKPQGFDVDVLYELQKRLGFQIFHNRILAMGAAEGLYEIKNGKADIMLGGISYDAERAKSYDLTSVMFTSSLTIMYNHRLNPNIKGLDDFRGKRIGVMPNSVYKSYLNEIGAIPVEVTNLIRAYFQIVYGKLDGYIGDRPPLDDFVHVFNSDQLTILEKPFGEQYCRYVLLLPKDSPYTEVISNEIDKMIADGTMSGLLKFWNIDHSDAGNNSTN